MQFNLEHKSHATRESQRIETKNNTIHLTLLQVIGVMIRIENN